MKLRSLLFTILLGSSLSTAFAQTYESSITPQQDIVGYGGTYTFTFTGLPAGGWGNAQLIVYYSGDFGDMTEYNDVFDEDGSTVGQAGPYASGSDCDGLDSTVLTFNASLIDGWMADNQVDFDIMPSMNVDPGNCTELFLQCKLVYNYCAFGTPTELASINLSEDLFCEYDDAIVLTGTPAGGTWSGTGVTGNMFNPAGLVPGSTINIMYTATDGIGCTTSSTEQVRIKRAPMANDTYACPGTSTEVTVNSGGTFVWFEDAALTQEIDTATSITTDLLDETTSYYVAGLYSTSSFTVDSIGVTDSMIVDHDFESGDDRGGIAITPDYFFVVGDDNTVRMDASDLANLISLPVRDGLFSDLGTGNLYSFWNTDDAEAPDNNMYNFPFTINAIRGLDTDLEFTAEVNTLDMEITVDAGSVILAGSGFVGILNGNDGHAYVIDMDDFSVQDLGTVSYENYYGENWADWGVLEYDGVDFSALYSNYDNDVVRQNLTTGTITAITNFNYGMSDMANITVSPWNNRWYFHYEGYGDVFGGNSETAGYANSGVTTDVIEANELGCYTEVEVVVNVIDFGGADTTACEYNVPVMLFAGNGYESYTWNGVNNDYNVFAAMEEGTYTVEAIDENGCTITSSIDVILDECLGVQEQSLADNFMIYPNPTFDNSTLTFSVTNSTEGTCTVVDMNGKILYTVAVDLTAGENTIEIPSQAFQSGIYLVQLSNNKGLTSTIRLVKN